MRAIASLLVLWVLGCGQSDPEDARPSLQEGGVPDVAVDSRETAEPPARQFCIELMGVLCARAAQCSPDAATPSPGAAEQCKAESANRCRTSGPSCPNGYDADRGRACVLETAAMSCADFYAGTVPASCSAACPSATVADAGLPGDGPVADTSVDSGRPSPPGSDEDGGAAGQQDATGLDDASADDARADSGRLELQDGALGLDGADEHAVPIPWDGADRAPEHDALLPMDGGDGADR